MENDSHLQYQSAPERPAVFDKQLLEICGVCPNNTDPYLRFVWGMDAVEDWGDRQVHRYPDRDDKYVGLPFWILEGWQSPDVYDLGEWEANKDILGEFPTRGVWDFIEILFDEQTGAFVPLGASALQKAREWRFWKSKGANRAVTDLLDRRALRAVEQENKWQARKRELESEFIERISLTEDKNAVFSFPSAKQENTKAFKQTAAGLLIPNKLKCGL